jgi:hypothetical protein
MMAWRELEVFLLLFQVRLTWRIIVFTRAERTY